MPEKTSEPNTRARRSQSKLTPKQRHLITEIEDIAASIRMDYWNICDYDEDGRTSILEVMKQQLIRGEIVMKYTLLDEFLSVIISNYYFKNPKSETTFKRLWQTKKFQLFAHYFLDETYLLNKMRLVHAIKEIPSDVRNALERINALRNAIAHSFFPENRRQYKAHKKVMYQGTNIFTKDGVAKFLADATRAEDYLMHQAFRVNLAAARAEIEDSG
jgi:hypothetical protein